jgi:hypothetical protein
MISIGCRISETFFIALAGDKENEKQKTNCYTDNVGNCADNRAAIYR